MKNKFKIIAELGSVHDGKLSLAKKLVKAASESGADTVKFQMHIAEEETLVSAPSPTYFNSESRYDYFKRIAFTFKEWKELKKTCKKYKVEFLCSPFSEKAVEILEKLKVNSYKVPSGELTNLPLLEKLKKTKKHLYLSTGMSNWKEINTVVNLLKKNFTLLQCSSIYPCPINNVGINVLEEMKKRYKCNVGFSDHTLDCVASFAAAANGANIIEKHFTLSKKMYGSDAKHSMEPEEFAYFVKNIRKIWHIMDNPVNKNNINKYKLMKNIFEKSVVAKKNLHANSILKKEDLSFKKPGTGIRALYYKSVVGRKLNKNIKANTLLKNSDFYEN